MLLVMGQYQFQVQAGSTELSVGKSPMPAPIVASRPPEAQGPAVWAHVKQSKHMAGLVNGTHGAGGT